MRRTRGSAPRDKPAIEKTLSAKGVSHTIVDAISAYGVVNISLRRLGYVKKRKAVGA